MDGAGRIAVVTGAARGVGAATARRLAERGLRVALLGRELATLEAVARSLPTDSCSLEVDVTDEAALRGAARSVAERMGPASVVVANAGIAAAGPFATTEAALWDRVIAVNLLGSAATARAFLPQLLRTRGYLLQVVDGGVRVGAADERVLRVEGRMSSRTRRRCGRRWSPRGWGWGSPICTGRAPG